MHKHAPGAIHRQDDVNLLVCTAVGAGSYLDAIRVVNENIQVGIRFSRFRRQDNAELGYTTQVELVQIAETVVGIEGLVGVLHDIIQVTVAGTKPCGPAV